LGSGEEADIDVGIGRRVGVEVGGTVLTNDLVGPNGRLIVFVREGSAVDTRASSVDIVEFD
jgi:hypothetical protein